MSRKTDYTTQTEPTVNTLTFTITIQVRKRSIEQSLVLISRYSKIPERKLRLNCIPVSFLHSSQLVVRITKTSTQLTLFVNKHYMSARKCFVTRISIFRQKRTQCFTASHVMFVRCAVVLMKLSFDSENLDCNNPWICLDIPDHDKFQHSKPVWISTRMDNGKLFFSCVVLQNLKSVTLTRLPNLRKSPLLRQNELLFDSLLLDLYVMDHSFVVFRTMKYVSRPLLFEIPSIPNIHMSSAYSEK